MFLKCQNEGKFVDVLKRLVAVFPLYFKSFLAQVKFFLISLNFFLQKSL